VIDADGRRAIEQAVLNLGTLDGVSTLTDLLIPWVRSALGRNG
jgi:hypothetical protein